MVRDSNPWHGVTAHWFSSFGDPGMAGFGKSWCVPSSPESRAFASVSCPLVMRRYCACGHRMATVGTEVIRDRSEGRARIVGCVYDPHGESAADGQD